MTNAWLLLTNVASEEIQLDTAELECLQQGWPKCGPPKIFCGPCVKFWIHNSAIYDAFMYENMVYKLSEVDLLKGAY